MMSSDKEPVNGCHGCGLKPKTYTVVRWSDLSFWCTTECWKKDMIADRIREEEKQRFLRTGVYLIPAGTIR
jgi:hypothetical protein